MRQGHVDKHPLSTKSKMMSLRTRRAPQHKRSSHWPIGVQPVHTHTGGCSPMGILTIRGGMGRYPHGPSGGWSLIADVVGENGTLTKRCGSPGYLPPQPLTGFPYSEKFDIFSTGVMLVMLFNGRGQVFNTHPLRLTAQDGYKPNYWSWMDEVRLRKRHLFCGKGGLSQGAREQIPLYTKKMSLTRSTKKKGDRRDREEGGTGVITAGGGAGASSTFPVFLKPTAVPKRSRSRSRSRGHHDEHRPYGVV